MHLWVERHLDRSRLRSPQRPGPPRVSRTGSGGSGLAKDLSQSQMLSRCDHGGDMAPLLTPSLSRLLEDKVLGDRFEHRLRQSLPEKYLCSGPLKKIYKLHIPNPEGIGFQIISP